MDFLLNFTLIVELFCLGIGLYFFKNNYSSKLKYTVVYVGIVLLIELISYQFRINGLKNQFLYNILGLAEFGIFIWIYYHLINSPRIKKLITFLIAISVILFLINGIYFSQPIFMTYLNFAFSFKSLVMAVIIMLFLFEIVRTEKVLYLKEVFAFWMSIGLLFFQVGNLPLILLNPYLESNVFINLILLIQLLCSILMYGSFIIGFIISKKEYNII